MSALTINFIIIAIVVAGWTAAVWAFYTHLDASPTRKRTARGHEVITTPSTGSRPATRQDVRRVA